MKIKATVGVILNQDKDKVYLSLRQKHQSYAGFWEFPGGKVDDDETYLDCLTRELYEEVGISVKEFSLLEKKDYVNKDNVHVFLEFYLVSEYINIPVAREGQKLELVNINDIHKYNILPASLSVIDILKSKLTNEITKDNNKSKY
jgi:8-oxo-dGTP diphosphatase